MARGQEGRGGGERSGEGGAGGCLGGEEGPLGGRGGLGGGRGQPGQACGLLLQLKQLLLVLVLLLQGLGQHDRVATLRLGLARLRLRLGLDGMAGLQPAPHGIAGHGRDLPPGAQNVLEDLLLLLLAALRIKAGLRRQEACQGGEGRGGVAVGAVGET